MYKFWKNIWRATEPGRIFTSIKKNIVIDDETFFTSINSTQEHNHCYAKKNKRTRKGWGSEQTGRKYDGRAAAFLKNIIYTLKNWITQ